MSIFTNYIPNKYKFFDDQEPHGWMTALSQKSNKKNSLFKQYVENGKTAHDYHNLQITELSDYIRERKNEYNFQLSQSLNNPAAGAKTYWTILKTFYSGKKRPVIPSLVINDQFITDFRKKANYFNF